MNKYHKIQSIFKRDPETKFKTFLMGEYSVPEFEYLADNEWVFTEKVDGTNIRVMWDGANVTFAGKTDEASIPGFLLSELEQTFSTTPARAKFRERFGFVKKSIVKERGGICMYGEGYGKKIQKVGAQYIADKTAFILSDVKVGHIWLERENVEDIAKFLGIPVVPIVGRGTLAEAIARVECGEPSRLGDLTMEGLVLRPVVELRDRMGQRVITKIKHKDFQS